MDLVGPPPQPREWFSHIMMMIDGSTRWVEAAPLSSTTTEACSVAFIEEWVTRFGVPALLTSDRGPQFTGTVWAAVCDKLGVQHWLTTAYHPQNNGMVEHVHRQIRDTLRWRECRQHWTTPCTGCFWGSRQRQRKIQQCLGRAGLYGSPLVVSGQFHNMEDALVPKECAPIVDTGPAADQAPHFNTAGRKSA